jgi:hypothetical protein
MRQVEKNGKACSLSSLCQSLNAFFSLAFVAAQIKTSIFFGIQGNVAYHKLTVDVQEPCLGAFAIS